MQFCSDSELFHQKLNEAELFDLPASGPLFTWTNKKMEGIIARKLDRLLVNSAWLEVFTNFKAEFLPPAISDHCAGSVTIQEEVVYNARKPFKFFSFWVKNDKFLDIVKAV
ncbi:hypothetical protein SLA2020_232620 [Shorea laevis]